MLDRLAQQLVPGGVELDLVDAVAVAIVGAELRRVLVGEGTEALGALAAGIGADRGDALLGPVGALAAHRLDQRPVCLEEVVVDQRRWLVGHLVVAGSRSLCGCHSVTIVAVPALSHPAMRPRRRGR